MGKGIAVTIGSAIAIACGVAGFALGRGDAHLPSWAMSKGAIARAAVRRSLLDPDSAVFRDERPSTVSAWTFCGEVNARNRVGGMVGFRRFVALLREDRQDSAFDEVNIEEDASGQESMPRGRAFDTVWSTYCQ